MEMSLIVKLGSWTLMVEEEERETIVFMECA
jgi:hypothetical protein